MTREEEAKAIRAVLDGDADAFEALVKACEKQVYHIALNMTGSEEDAFDISQDVFLKAYRSLRSFRQESSFQTWVCRLAANRCIDFLRKQKRRGKTVSLDEPDDLGRLPELPDERYAPEQVVERRERTRLLRAAMQKLPEDQRIILVLREVEGFSYQEISEALELEPGTVKSRIARARARLAELLTEHGNFFPAAASKGKGRR